MEGTNKTTATTAKKAAEAAVNNAPEQVAQQPAQAAQAAAETRVCGGCVFSFDRCGIYCKCAQAPVDENLRKVDTPAGDCRKYEARHNN